MMKKNMRFGHLVVLLVISSLVASQTTPDMYGDNGELITGSPLRLNGQHDHPRGPSRFQYSISLLAKENSRLRLATFNQSGAVYWAFAKFKQGDAMDTAPAPLPLFHLSNPAIRNNQSIRESFACTPSESQCNEITVGRFDNFKYLGSYSYQSFINTLDSLYVDYNISMAVSKTKVECSGVNEPSACSITPETISVKSGQEVKVTCSIIIAQNSPYDVSLDYVMATACPNAKSTIEQINRPSFVSTPNEDSTNVIFYKISKTCFRQFDKYDHNTEFKCELKSTNQSSVPLELQPWDTYDQASLKLDVHYGPELVPTSPHHYNQTLIVGTNRLINFSCPYVANPDPEYFWRVAYVSYNQNQSHIMKNGSPMIKDTRDRRRLGSTEFLSSGRDYSIPNNLEIGTYVFECKAQSRGLIVNVTSDIAKFYLNIIPNPVNVKKDNRNIGAIIGGVIGGLLAIIILVLGIVYFIKKYRNDNSMDEIEKAKDRNRKDMNNLEEGNETSSSVSTPNTRPSDDTVDEASGSSETASLSKRRVDMSKLSPSPSGTQRTDGLPVIKHGQSSNSLSENNNETAKQSTTLSPSKQQEITGLRKVNDLTNSAHNFLDFQHQQMTSSSGSLSNLESRTMFSPPEPKPAQQLGTNNTQAPRGVKVLPTSSTAPFRKLTKEQPDGNGVLNGVVGENKHHHNQMNGLSHKVAASLMMPSTTIKSYAAIASQAAAAAAQQRSNHAAAAAAAAATNGQATVEPNGNLLFNQHNKSYNNPGFFESSTSYHSIIQNHLESPPPYEPAPNQQSTASTPKKHMQQSINQPGIGGANSMNNLQYTTVQDIDGNRSRSRNALNHNNLDSNEQYTTVAQLNPINV